MTDPRTVDTQPSPGRRPLAIGPLAIDPPVLMAPMAGFTDYAFRQMVRRFGGVGLAAVEMVSARGFLEIDARDRHLPGRLWGVDREMVMATVCSAPIHRVEAAPGYAGRREPGHDELATHGPPLAVQIWDNNPQSLAKAGARLAHDLGVSVVDINFGCPVKVVTERAKSGSYLLRYPDRVGAIVARVVEACRPTPVTAKIRLGSTRDSVNARDVAQAIEDAGGAAVTVHGRTGDQMFRGRADWHEIARIKPHLRRIPLVGNGDLDSPDAVLHAFRQYGVDGVMIGRAALGRPWLFAQVRAALAGEPIPPDPSLAQQRDLLLEHYRLIVQQHGGDRGAVRIRKVACSYAQNWRGARRFRREVCRATTAEEFIDVVVRFFGHDPPPADGSVGLTSVAENS